MRVYVVNKPLNLTSHDVVAQARRTLGTRRVGHGGTLDPLATGVLALLVDEGTKLSPFLTDSRKSYLAWVSFGATTETLDAEGPLSESPGGPVPDRGHIEKLLPRFLELTEQVPPQYSAVKREGVKGYEAARSGRILDLPARPAGYLRVDLLGFAQHRDDLPNTFTKRRGLWMPDRDGRRAPLPEPLGEFPTALISLEVKAGTYVRSFARDLGAALGTGAFLSGLLRTSAGELDLSMSVELEELSGATPVPPLVAIPYQKITLDATQAERVRKGQRLPIRLTERTAFVDENGGLIAVAEEQEGRMKLLRVWSGN